MNNTIRTRLLGVIAAIALLPGCASGSTLTSGQARNALIDETEAGDYWNQGGIWLTPPNEQQTLTQLFDEQKPGGMSKECSETWSQAWHPPSENEKVYATTIFKGSSSGNYLEVLIRDPKSKDFSTDSFKKLSESCTGDYSTDKGETLTIEKPQVIADVNDVETLNMTWYDGPQKSDLSKSQFHAIRGNVRRVTFQIICISGYDETKCQDELRRLTPVQQNKIKNVK